MASEMKGPGHLAPEFNIDKILCSPELGGPSTKALRKYHSKLYEIPLTQKTRLALTSEIIEKTKALGIVPPGFEPEWCDFPYKNPSDPIATAKVLSVDLTALAKERSPLDFCKYEIPRNVVHPEQLRVTANEIVGTKGMCSLQARGEISGIGSTNAMIREALTNAEEGPVIERCFQKELTCPSHEVQQKVQAFNVERQKVIDEAHTRTTIDTATFTRHSISGNKNLCFFRSFAASLYYNLNNKLPVWPYTHLTLPVFLFLAAKKHATMILPPDDKAKAWTNFKQLTSRVNYTIDPEFFKSLDSDSDPIDKVISFCYDYDPQYQTLEQYHTVHVPSMMGSVLDAMMLADLTGVQIVMYAKSNNRMSIQSIVGQHQDRPIMVYKEGPHFELLTSRSDQKYILGVPVMGRPKLPAANLAVLSTLVTPAETAAATAVLEASEKPAAPINPGADPLSIQANSIGITVTELKAMMGI